MLKPTQKIFLEDIFGFFLSVEKPNLPERVTAIAKEKGLFEKPECHVSVVVEKSAVNITDALAKIHNSEHIKKEIIDLFNHLDFEYDLTDTYSLQEKTYSREELDERGLRDEPVHIRCSIIQLIHMPDVEIFFNKVSQLLNTNVDMPVPHITIFAWSDYDKKKNRGIGISSQKDFESFNQGFL